MAKNSGGTGDGFIDSLFHTTDNGNTHGKKLSHQKKGKAAEANQVAKVPEKRLTKKEKKLKESQSLSRTIVDIISDTKSGEPLKGGGKLDKRKRDKKADAKVEKALEESAKLIVEQPDSSSDKDEATAGQASTTMQPVMKFVNGKAVLEMPKTLSTSKAIENIKHTMGPSVVQNKDKKMSSLDYKKRDSTDRWSKQDTQKFYMALQLMGTDFDLVETLFEGKRTRKQIKNKFNKEQRADMAKINKLLEDRIELQAYELVHGELPEALRQQSTLGADEEDKESEESSSSSSDELVESDYQVKGLGKVADEEPQAVQKTNFFDISLPPRLPFMSFGQSLEQQQAQKTTTSNSLFGRQLNRNL